MSDLQANRRAIFRVSKRGQFSLPASARRRWGLEEGGEVEVFDLGSCVVMLPIGADSARASVARALDAQRYRRHIGEVADPELRDE